MTESRQRRRRRRCHLEETPEATPKASPMAAPKELPRQPFHSTRRTIRHHRDPEARSRVPRTRRTSVPGPAIVTHDPSSCPACIPTVV
jgi:hypothetical protein